MSVSSSLRCCHRIIPSLEQSIRLADTPSARSKGEHTYSFNVAMTCGGCSGAVQRVLSKMEGMCPSQHIPENTLKFCWHLQQA